MAVATDLHPATVRLLRALAEPASHSAAEAAAARQTWIEAGYPDLPGPAATNLFGELLAAKRLAAGLTQRDLVRTLAGVRGAHISAVARWESGEDLPDAGQLAALFAVLPWTEADRAEALRRAYDASLLRASARLVRGRP